MAKMCHRKQAVKVSSAPSTHDRQLAAMELRTLRLELEQMNIIITIAANAFQVRGKVGSLWEWIWGASQISRPLEREMTTYGGTNGKL
jgi:DNA mismatch repair protein MutH